MFFFALMFLRLDFLLKIEDLKGVALGRKKHGKNKHFIVNDLVAIVLQLSSLEFCFFLRSCGVVCDGNYSLKNAQGSGRGRLDSLVVQFPLLHFGTRRWRDSLKKSCNSRVWRRRGGFLPVKEVEEGEDSKSWINDWTTFLRHSQDSPSPVFRNRHLYRFFTNQEW